MSFLQLPHCIWRCHSLLFNSEGWSKQRALSANWNQNLAVTFPHSVLDRSCNLEQQTPLHCKYITIRFELRYWRFTGFMYFQATWYTNLASRNYSHTPLRERIWDSSLSSVHSQHAFVYQCYQWQLANINRNSANYIFFPGILHDSTSFFRHLTEIDPLLLLSSDHIRNRFTAEEA